MSSPASCPVSGKAAAAPPPNQKLLACVIASLPRCRLLKKIDFTSRRVSSSPCLATLDHRSSTQHPWPGPTLPDSAAGPHAPAALARLA
ncbi:hypothetical protein HYPSUDRAFT_37171 [Hypholoma sublateritium FD-334 SS-4]|uniref:Uncharacterized protein n=1 Tax=Hypholoma sublateritium (strain FD-334 SS-4) TaxID=945553 RepID=A0A0D2LE62_HYPSF|nr:hypothetical protein HYPSUDRAFT_37171 [Hypholoma sublateritium FD-334 SS-4]